MRAHQQSGNSPDTIAAVSTGSGRAAVAVIRVSGPQAGEAVRALAGKLPEPRRALLAKLRHPSSLERLDEGLVLWFPAPASATGEDMAEFQIHGGRAVVAAVLGALLAVPGVRPADAGEFTRRGFLNGRMDLSAVEGLADLIAADTEGQRRLAFAHAFGHLGQRAEQWRARLVRAMALIEAGIDFPDEDDIPAETRAAARPEVEVLHAELTAALADRRGGLLREGATIAIAGLPNAGKSSLMNALAARDVAIVSDEPGTTRDVLEVALDLAGHRVALIDTAGLREASGVVEAEGIRRARERIARADLVLWVHDASAGPAPGTHPDMLASEGAALWLVSNKSDAARAPVPSHPIWANCTLSLSAKTGVGIPALIDSLTEWTAARVAGAEHPVLIRERHRAAAGEAAGHLAEALAAWDGLSDELLAEELRRAAHAIGRITGRIDTDDLLDVVFREFCIGK
ncbi:tRNA uridine-5-carboxymethylaminomethyl(34) synthesis GTPase MnmE [Starkeya sp. ORNL1]|uniref:tRNA uridine-5-carboxymethylaminomethyl(34) synthesis GTPase MnmE n=1 Tax=Starkeya sp. ORNL1 TaxID=2709380 RepID=UPI0014647523|nr:tRNA uridine-5-carboxymethylaminomethyl(34) synthesis GTPase MnmE [Starkeya sp. ORNL1]QJP15515.1 tRNA uridine-5-carboxymethylaminomethyl(34) synthesis GTPase MnmE [Starkeya sp. ORNL1]